MTGQHAGLWERLLRQCAAGYLPFPLLALVQRGPRQDLFSSLPAARAVLPVSLGCRPTSSC